MSTNPVARMRHVNDTAEGLTEGQRMASLDLAVQVATLRAEHLQGRAKNEPEKSSPLLAEALSALEHAHAELAAACDELHEHVDAMLATRLERELEWARYRDLFETAPVAYIETDMSGIVIEANRRAGELLDVFASRLVGKPLAVFIARVDRVEFRDMLFSVGAKPQRGSMAVRLKPRNLDGLISAQAEVAPVDGQLGRAPALRWVFVARCEEAVVVPAGPASGPAPLAEALARTAETTRNAIEQHARRPRRRSCFSISAARRTRK